MNSSRNAKYNKKTGKIIIIIIEYTAADRRSKLRLDIAGWYSYYYMADLITSDVIFSTYPIYWNNIEVPSYYKQVPQNKAKTIKKIFKCEIRKKRHSLRNGELLYRQIYMKNEKHV